MTSGVARMALAVALVAVGTPVWAQGDAARVATQPSLARMLAAPRIDPRAVAALYRQAAARDGTAALDALDAQIAAAARRPGAPAPERARALLIGALIAWQDGRIDAATTAADAALALDVGIDARLLRARLFDAAGRPAQAAPLYAAAADATPDAPERLALRLRAAIAGGDDDAKAIRALAEQAPSGVRRGIADLLGIRGDPADALATYRPVAAGVTAYSAQVRIAQWAIAAGDRDAAAQAAWAASRAAATATDRRYALALLAETFRNARDMAGLLTLLERRPADADVTQLRIDTLVELGRVDDALALLRASTDPAFRSQLPGLLDLAGRRVALIAEYERLIARDPAALRWYDALAVVYLSGGERAKAMALFRRLFAANPGNPALLSDAARRMIAMGLGEEGQALLGNSGVGRTAAMRLFQFESEATQGRNDAAAAILADLDRRLPPADPQRIAIADGYERLGRDGDALRVLTAVERAGYRFGFDEQLHVVRLEREQRQDAAALDRLLALWFVTDLPAQRGFVETQIVETARRLDRIDAVSDRMRARVAAGDDRAVELLVALRIARSDGPGAAAAVAAFARTAGNVPARLQRLAALQRRLYDRTGYRATLERLADADPARAAGALQQLIGEIAIPPRRGTPVAAPVGQLEALLARLAATRRSDPAAARRFAAGIYAAARQSDRAIGLYRQAAAMAPGDQEAVLGLVNELNASGARAQAVALLQYRAEFAASAAEQAQALEALAGVLAATSGGAEVEQSPQFAAARLAWARRGLYWRMAQGEEDAGLYDQLADLSEQIGDSRIQRRVREASLAVPGTQRAATLRQLIALSSGSAGGGNGAAIGDVNAKAVYGRRLTALRQAYPADVYAELAGAMLAQRDPAGAERAFGLIEAIPGLVNVDALRADGYAAAGYLAQALTGYSRALLRERGNAGLILKTAILQEQVGDPATARDLYWQSLRDAVLRLPLATTVDRGDTPSPFEDSMLEGLLFTWPTDAASRAPIASQMETLMRDAVSGDGPATWRRAARAQRLLAIARRLAAGGRDAALLAAVEPLVAARFACDEAFVRERAAFRDRTGLPTAPMLAVTTDGDWIGAAIEAQARSGTNAELRLTLALDRGDDIALTRLFEIEAKAEVARRAALGPTDFVFESPLNAMLMMAGARLSAAQLRSTVLEPLDRAGIRETALFDLYRTEPDRLARMDEVAGTPLLSADRLTTLLRTRFNDPVPRRMTLRRRGGTRGDPFAAMLQRFSLDQQVSLYAGLAEDGQRTGSVPVLMAPLEARILRQPLSGEQQARMTTALRQAMGTETLVASLAQRLFALTDVPAANRPIVSAGAAALAERSPMDAGIAEAIDAYLRGDRAAALETLLRIAETPGGDAYAPGAIQKLLADDYRRAGQAFLAVPDPDAAARARFYQRYVRVTPAAYGGTDADQRRYLERLVTLEPTNAIYIAALVDRLWSDNERDGVLALLTAFVAAQPDDRDAAAVLQMVQLLLGQDAAAAALAARSRVDVNDPDTLVELLARVQAASDSDNGPPTFLRLFGYVYAGARQEKPALRGVAAIEARRQQDQSVVQPVPADLFDPVVLAMRDPLVLPATLRGVWRRSAADAETPDDTAAVKRTMLLDRLGDIDTAAIVPDRPVADPVAGALSATPAMVAELDTELHLLDPVVRQQQQPFYDLVAAGAMRQRMADARIDALLARLDGGLIDAHELHALATLAVRSGRVPTPAQLKALRTATQRMPTMSARERILMSQLFARGGDAAAAQAWLEAAAMQILYIDVADLAGGSALATFDTLVAALRSWPDQAAAATAHAALAARIEHERAIMPPDDVPGPLPPLAPAA